MVWLPLATVQLTWCISNASYMLVCFKFSTLYYWPNELALGKLCEADSTHTLFSIRHPSIHVPVSKAHKTNQRWYQNNTRLSQNKAVDSICSKCLLFYYTERHPAWSLTNHHDILSTFSSKSLSIISFPWIHVLYFVKVGQMKNPKVRMASAGLGDAARSH